MAFHQFNAVSPRYTNSLGSIIVSTNFKSRVPTYVADNAWHSRPFPSHFTAHFLPLFDHRVKPSTSLCIKTLYYISAYA
ncbi:hypothetical protein VN97_g3369 [Penicillium thymicola]|uniref:Uncharacterized protein n=1 Tax=Penicillium thymicola TaxID=293382 RepID=A0AAI9TML3_PENTH|nr:hypothetical protein VN97_g3369 [Penicillium thymicola]